MSSLLATILEDGQTDLVEQLKIEAFDGIERDIFNAIRQVYDDGDPDSLVYKACKMLDLSIRKDAILHCVNIMNERAKENIERKQKETKNKTGI